MADHDRNLIAELEKRLIWYREEAAPEEFDVEEVDAICTMLQKLSPIEEQHRTKEEAYQNIMRRIQKEEKAKPFSFLKKKGYRAAVIFIGAFAAALLSLNMVTYAREDKSLFTMILEKVGLLEIVKERTTENDAVILGGETGTFYDSWAELDSEIKSKIVVPNYIPNGYMLYGVESYTLNDRNKVKANYYNQKNGHIVITITLWKDKKEEYREKAIDESSCTLLSEYSDENTLYYAYEDEYICIIFRENSFYRISGNLALEEMLKVGEGIR